MDGWGFDIGGRLSVQPSVTETDRLNVDICMCSYMLSRW